MFQFIRRFSGSFLPRPDRPWRDDATSHAPTIGRKRRHSVTEQDRDGSASISKRTKNDIVKPDTECDSVSGGGSPEGDAISPVEGQDVKGVTEGVKEVDLEDKLKVEVASSIWPEGIPLPDSPSASPEPESESQEPESPQSDEVEQTKDEEHADDKDSLASSRPGDDVEEGAEEEPATTNTDASQDEITPAQEVIIAVESGLHDTPDILEVNTIP
ncbi:hypothetical protein L210DRAFT_846212 [Boletus edulis BED1]|uniref:Uncharacterized protein n=1 Tax=Boletus edulis BED1 TaxID=1328754 RepID=A0AAD4CA29_BOLED|nr:hypothetical protein L210DRAFT_846212 [Boletus edulis BED1]